MDESDRLKKKIQPPNPTEWNNQMYRMRVFSSLVRDTDRNLTNVLITPEWKVDDDRLHARRSGCSRSCMHQKDLAKIDRRLLPRLEALTKDGVKQATTRFPDQARDRRDDEAPRPAGRALQEADRRARRRQSPVLARPSSAGGDGASPRS